MRGFPFLISFQDTPYNKPIIALNYGYSLSSTHCLVIINEIWNLLATDHGHIWQVPYEFAVGETIMLTKYLFAPLSFKVFCRAMSLGCNQLKQTYRQTCMVL